ncbi:hypothetical protein C0Q70_19534 [Pomacea canaliculata]|uniref:Uncharacterized protein n=1 Tax=Pomacea canaliculata TaxID=400727 RepID=A0A2T7NJM2_POMCA|nr:hypothetical protein C0Q70_19534 [Pomacea canaliculata]
MFITTPDDNTDSVLSDSSRSISKADDDDDDDESTQYRYALGGLGHDFADDAEVHGEGQKNCDRQRHLFSRRRRQQEDEDIEERQHHHRDDGVEDVERTLPVQADAERHPSVSSACGQIRHSTVTQTQHEQSRSHIFKQKSPAIP